MTNTRFPTLADYRDVETLNSHRESIEQGLSLKEIMAAIHAKSRDNARTPIQWSGTLPNAGFTHGNPNAVPWICVNSNYTEINVEQSLNDPQSIFYHYQKLIELRREIPLIVYGKYDILHEDNTHIFLYKRYNDDGQEIIVGCNFSQEPTKIDDRELSQRLRNHKKILISNYDQNNKSDWLEFRSYEAWALEIS